MTPSSSADGAPLSELSWSSSLAVVAVSFSGLFTVIALMLACLCCKKGGIGFKVRAGGPRGCGRDPKGWALLCPLGTEPPSPGGLPTGGPWRPAHCLPHFGPPLCGHVPAQGQATQCHTWVGHSGTVRMGLARAHGGLLSRLGRGLASPDAPDSPVEEEGSWPSGPQVPAHSNRQQETKATQTCFPCTKTTLPAGPGASSTPQGGDRVPEPEIRVTVHRGSGRCYSRSLS